MSYPNPPSWLVTIGVALLVGIVVGALGSFYILQVVGYPK